MTGSLMASLVFIPVTALPQQELLDWGWRIPFLLSAVLVVIAAVVRRSVEETPVFKTEVSERRIVTVPLLALFREQWKSVLRVFLGTFFAMIQILFLVFGLYFATSKAVGLPSSQMLLIQGIATAVCAVMTPVWALVSDRIGRRVVWLSTTLSSGILIFAYFWVISTGNVFWITVLAILMFGVAYAGPNGLWPAFMSEQFTPSVRFSGLAIGVQAGLLVAGFAPAFSVGLAGPELNWVPVGLFGAACAFIAGIAMFTARETYRTRTDALGAE
jgi:MFS family permease